MGPRRHSYTRFLDDQSIRLLRILKSHPPSAKSDQTNATAQDNRAKLHLELETYAIESPPNYRALSYTWGPPEEGTPLYAASDMVQIFLDGERHLVSPNLFNALLQLNESFAGSYFWVDAICINQADVFERQLHVAIMDKIYRNAEEVIIWLGKANSSSEQVTQLVRHISGLGESTLQKFAYDFHPDQLTKLGLPDLTSIIWPRYLELYELRWFNRGWVIQEVVLAKRAVAFWGRFMMTWPELIAGSKIFLPDQMRKTFFARLLHVEHKDNLPLGRNALRVGLIQDACLHCDYESLLIVELTTGTRGFASPAHILVHLMRMARDFSWTDTRDKVYSLLGLIHYATEIQRLPRLSLEPDYGACSTPATVLTAAASIVIRSSNYLGTIAQVSDESFREIPGLPSWVPDYIRAPNFSMGRENPFDACRFRSLGMLGFSIKNTSLFVKGIRIGTMRGTADPQQYTDFEKIADMLLLAADTHMPLGQDRADVLWRTMIWDTYGHAFSTDEHPAPSALAESFISWIASTWRQGGSPMQAAVLTASPGSPQEPDETQCLARSAPEISVTSRIHAIIASHSNGSRDNHLPHLIDQPGAEAEVFTSFASGVTWAQQLFRTDTGYLGMGPRSGNIDDEVWVISGCPFPMTIRRLNDPGTLYHVMGRAYVHGVMHGEAVTEGSRWEDICFE